MTLTRRFSCGVFGAALFVAIAILTASPGAQAQTGPCTTAGYSSTYSQCQGNAVEASTVVTSAETVRAAATQTAGLIADRISAFTAPTSAPSVAYRPQKYTGNLALGNNGNIRVDDGQETGVAAGNGPPRVGVWVSGGYSYLDFDKAGSQYDGDLWVGAVGADYQLSDRILVGLAGTAERSDLDTPFNSGSEESDGYTIAAYSVFRIDRTFSIDVSGGYTTLDYDVERRDPITNALITGSTDAERWFGAANLNAQYVFDRVIVGGNLGTVYATEDKDAFTESNGVAVAAKETDVGEGHIGARVGYSLGALQPYLRGLARYYYEDGGSGDSSDFVVGAGVLLNWGNVTGLIDATSVEGRDDTENYTITGTLRITF